MSAARRRKPGVPSRRISSGRSQRRKVESGQRAGRDDLELQSYEVGAMPLLNVLLERMRLAEILAEHLPPDDPRTELPTVCALLVLLRNVLIARDSSRLSQAATETRSPKSYASPYSICPENSINLARGRCVTRSCRRPIPGRLSFVAGRALLRPLGSRPYTRSWFALEKRAGYRTASTNRARVRRCTKPRVNRNPAG